MSGLPEGPVASGDILDDSDVLPSSIIDDSLDLLSMDPLGLDHGPGPVAEPMNISVSPGGEDILDLEIDAPTGADDMSFLQGHK